MSNFHDTPPYAWKTVRVFISSTFRDFHAERDYLVKHVFPELRQWCLQFRLHLVDIDLRWGVTRQEAESGKVIDICLEQIDGCRPFFLGLLGSRYGWVPDLSDISTDARERYDRIKGKEGYSITHLEIEHAVLQQLGTAMSLAGMPQAFFYFRDAESLPLPEMMTDLSDQERAEYSRTFLEEDGGRIEKLKELKRTIITHYERKGLLRGNPDEVRERVFTYTPQFDPTLPNPEDDKLSGRFTPESLRPLGERIAEDLKRSIGEQFQTRIEDLSRKYEELDPLSAEKDFHEAFVENRTRLFIGRTALLEQLHAYIDVESDTLLEVYGEPGSGKSALLAQFYRQLCEKYVPPAVGDTPGGSTERALIIPHFVGASPESTSLPHLLKRMCEEMFTVFLKAEMEEKLAALEDSSGGKDSPDKVGSHIEEQSDADNVGAIIPEIDIDALPDFFADAKIEDIRKEYEIPLETNQLSLQFKSFLKKMTHRVIIIIDGLNQLDETGDAHALLWLPNMLPGNVKVIASSLPGRAEEALRRKTDQSVIVGRLSEDERRDIIRHLPSVFAKTLESHHINELLKKEATDNPLFLKVAIEELRVFGSFEKLGEKIHEFPDEVVALFEYLLGRLESEHGRDVVERLFLLLECSRFGLSQGELGELMQSVDGKGAHLAILRQIRDYLQQRGETIDFFHRGLSKAVRNTYLAPRSSGEGENGAEDKKSCYHRILAEYFAGELLFIEDGEGKRPQLRKLLEQCWQQLQAGMWSEVCETLTDLRYYTAKLSANMIVDLMNDLQLALERLPESEDRALVSAFEKAFSSERYHLQGLPEITFQQMYNRLQWQGGRVASILDRQKVEYLASGGSFLHQYRKPHIEKTSLLSTLVGHRAVFDGIERCRYSVDGSKIFSVSALELKIWDCRSESVIASFDIDHSLEHYFDCSEDGRFIAASCDNGMRIRIWYVENGEEYRSITPGGWRSEFALSPDGHLLASLGAMPADERAQESSETMSLGGKDVLQIWDCGTGELISSIGVGELFDPTIIFSADSTCIFAKLDRQHLTKWDSREGRQLCSFVTEGSIREVTVSPDTTKMAVRIEHEMKSDELLILNGRDLSECAHPEISYGYKRTIFSEDGRRFLTIKDTLITVYDSDTYKELCTLKYETEDILAHIRCAAFSPDSRRVAAALGKSVKVWELSSGKECETFTGHTEEVTCAAFSPDGSRVVSGCKDMMLRIWDVGGDGGRERHSLRGHRDDCIRGSAFNCDGRRAVTISEQECKIWDAVSGKELRGISPPDRCFGTAFAVSPDGERVALGGNTRNAIWNVGTGEIKLLNEVKSISGEHLYTASMVFSADGKNLILACGSMHEVRVLSCESGSEITSWQGVALDWLTIHERKLLAGIISDSTEVLSQAQRILKASETYHTESLRTFSLSPQKDRILTGTKFEMYLWDMHTGSFVFGVKRGENQIMLRHYFSPDGTMVMAEFEQFKSDEGDEELYFIQAWSCADGADKYILPIGSEKIKGYLFSPDASKMITYTSHEIMVWDSKSGSALYSGQSGKWETFDQYRFSADGGLIFVNYIDGNVLEMYDSDTSELVYSFFTEGKFWTYNLSPDGTRILLPDESGNIYFLKFL